MWVHQGGFGHGGMRGHGLAYHGNAPMPDMPPQMGAPGVQGMRGAAQRGVEMLGLEQVGRPQQWSNSREASTDVQKMPRDKRMKPAHSPGTPAPGESTSAKGSGGLVSKEPWPKHQEKTCEDITPH